MAQKHKPSNQANQQKNDKPEASKDDYPLLSYYKAGDDTNLPAGPIGKFSSFYTDNFKPLAIVLENMEGRRDDRASIPSALAQIDALAMMLEHLRPSSNSKPASVSKTIDQWRGAITLLLFSPLLSSQRAPLYWEEHTVNQNDTNIFLRSLNSALDMFPPAENNAKTFEALCVKSTNWGYPLFLYRDKCIVVPAACGVERSYFRLPWTEDKDDPNAPTTVQLNDPRGLLGLSARKLLSDQLTALSVQPEHANIHIALSEFARDLRNSIPAPEAYYEDKGKVEVDLLKALLLRNMLNMETTLQIVPTLCPPTATGMTALMDKLQSKKIINDPAKYFQEIAPYTVLLNGEAVAYLNEKDLLWCPFPGAVIHKSNSAYEQLRSALDALPSDVQERALYHQIQAMERISNWKNHPLINALKKDNPNIRGGVDDVHVPLVIPMAAENEASLVGTCFEPLKLLIISQNGDQELFAEEALLVRDTRLYDMDEAEDLFDSEERVMSVACPIENGQVGFFSGFYPLGKLGADTIARNGYSLQSILSPELRQLDGTLRLSLSLSIVEHRICYEITSSYDKGKNLFVTESNQADLPSIALWPNIQDDTGSDSWKVFYSFIVYHPAEYSNRFTAKVYDSNGLCTSSIIKLDKDVGKYGRRWQTCLTSSRPQYAIFYMNGHSIGIVSFEDRNAKRLTRREKRLILCLDYGTTSTIGYVYDPADREGVFIPIDDNHFRCYVRNEEISRPAAMYFMDTGFGLPSQGASGSLAGRQGSILSIFHSFDKEFTNISSSNTIGLKPFLDGHIFYAQTKDMNGAERDDLYTGLKIDLKNSTSTSMAKTFLKQLLYFFLLICREKQASHVEIRYAVPEALDEQSLDKLQHIYEQIVAPLSNEVGMEITLKGPAWESLAAGAHFRNLSRPNAAVLQQGILVLDIGGGTSDYSFWRQGKSVKSGDPVVALQGCSNMLAGREMFARVLQNAISTGRRDIVEELLEAIKEEVQGGESRGVVEEWCKQVSELSENNIRLLDRLTLLVDVLMNKAPFLLRRVFEKGKCQRLLEVISFNIGLLLWIARMLHASITGRYDYMRRQEKLVVCLAGNGSNYFFVLPKERQDKLTDMLRIQIQSGHSQVYVNGTQGGAMETRDLTKQEIVRGLLDDSIFTDYADATRIAKLDRTSAAKTLTAFLADYASEFPQDRASIEYLRGKSDKLMDMNLQTRISDICGTLQEVNRNIVDGIAYYLNGIE